MYDGATVFEKYYYKKGLGLVYKQIPGVTSEEYEAKAATLY